MSFTSEKMNELKCYKLTHCQAATLGKLFNTNVTKQYNLVPCEGFHANVLVMWLPCMDPMNKGSIVVAVLQ